MRLPPTNRQPTLENTTHFPTLPEKKTTHTCTLYTHTQTHTHTCWTHVCLLLFAHLFRFLFAFCPNHFTIFFVFVSRSKQIHVLQFDNAKHE